MAVVADATSRRKSPVSERRLEVRGLRAGYASRVVIDDIDLTIDSGDWFVLMGPNGCGKSTLLDCIVGRLQPAAGTVIIAGHALGADPLQAKRRLGYAVAPESLPGLLTARQCIEIHAGAKGLAVIQPALLELAEELQFLPYLESFVDTLSLGTRQKLSILLALVGQPLLVVLDEAFNGLDPASALVVKKYLRRLIETEGAAVLLATHALDIVEHYASRASLLIDGRLKREWSRAEIKASLTAGDGFEVALSAAMAADRGVAGA